MLCGPGQGREVEITVSRCRWGARDHGTPSSDALRPRRSGRDGNSPSKSLMTSVDAADRAGRDLIAARDPVFRARDVLNLLLDGAEGLTCCTCLALGDVDLHDQPGRSGQSRSFTVAGTLSGMAAQAMPCLGVADLDVGSAPGAQRSGRDFVDLEHERRPVDVNAGAACRWASCLDLMHPAVGEAHRSRTGASSICQVQASARGLTC